MKKTLFKGLALSLVVANIILPYAKKLTGSESDGRIIKMNCSKKFITTGKLAYYILPGIVCPPYQEYNHFVQGDDNYWMKGRCYFVDYGPDHYNPSDIAKMIANHIKENGFTEVRFLTISIGDQIIPFLAEELSGTDVECKSWSIDPCLSPNYLWENIRRPLQRGMPFACIAKFIFGWLGQKRIIPWDCEMRSYAEICEQASAITYADYTYNDNSLPTNFKIAGAIYSSDNEFIDVRAFYLNPNHCQDKHRFVSGLKHCRFSEDWHTYLSTLADLEFYK